MTASTDKTEAEIDATRQRISENIDQIRNRLSPGELLDQAMGYLKSGPGDYAGEMASNLGRSVRDNPLPVMLLGVGAAWLMMSGSSQRPRQVRGPEYWDDPYEDYYEGYDEEESFYDEMDEDLAVGETGAYQTGETYPYTAVEGEEGRSASGESGGAARTAAEARERAQRMAGAAGQSGAAAREHAQRTADRARGGARDAAGRLIGGARSGRQSAAEVSRRTGQRARGVGKQAAGFFEDQPIALAALGIATGALLGGIISQTRTEHRVMGPVRDRLRDEAVAKGNEELQRTERVMEAGIEAGQREAESQGLTAGEAAERVKQAEDSAAKVVKAGKKGAEAEQERQKEKQH